MIDGVYSQLADDLQLLQYTAEGKDFPAEPRREGGRRKPRQSIPREAQML
jgi:hypothetical protein